MSSFGRPALAVALLLMLAPLSRDAGTAEAARAGIELVRGGKPADAPCAWAKPGRICYDGHGLSTAEGRRRR
jgi:hypothetical protein